MNLRTCLLSLLMALPACAADAAPAEFWLSVADSGPVDPEAPSVTAVDSLARRLHIWAQPQTTGSTLLENVSLNVVSSSTAFSIDPNTVEVYNPTYSSSRPRFEYVSDSADGLISVDTGLPGGMPRGIAGLQGFTIHTSNADGFGGSCDASDDYCGATSGGDAWLFASFSLTPSVNTGTADLHLQVGLNGMNHSGEGPGDMTVRFGVESKGPAPAEYDPSIDYDTTLANDDPDVVLTFVRPGDYDADGDVDSADYDEWISLYGSNNTAADGNSDGTVDAADYTVWRDNYPPPAPEATVVAPEPTSLTLLLTLLTLTRGRRRKEQ